MDALRSLDGFGGDKKSAWESAGNFDLQVLNLVLRTT